MIIACVDESEYTTFACEKHGIFQQRVDVADGKCPYCQQKCEKVKNIHELKKQFRKELNLS